MEKITSFICDTSSKQRQQEDQTIPEISRVAWWKNSHAKFHLKAHSGVLYTSM